MFTQKETRMNIELVQNKYKPIITHDMHQQGGNGSRIFVPPFTDPFDVELPSAAARSARHASARRWRRRCWRKAKKAWRGVEQLRHVVAGAAIHGLPRPAAHPDRDRQQQPRRSVREPAEGPAARPAGIALELPGAVLERHVDARPAGGLRRHRRARRHVARREVRPRLALQLLSRASRLGELQQEAPIAFVVPADAARSVRDLRDARHPEVRRRRDPQGHRRVHAPTASSTRQGRG